MTDKQIKKMREDLRSFRNSNNANFYMWCNTELDCRDMINSCLCYGTDFLNSRYSERYINELGREKVEQLYKEQKADFDKATVNYNVHTDSEGVTYNSIRWEDD